MMWSSLVTKDFLMPTPVFFERMFETDCKETQSGKAKLNLSEEGLKAFLTLCIASSGFSERASTYRSGTSGIRP
ncbi:hypothetical protein Ocin01_13659 [Orchesella cincta]|uniref:Uncharacterized protein n=1 Tax=Orchesella cincta TaxID=48709 RepID=A0A1D2MJH7_ORCCI|nr:hypothetical protein Ocin01_13659 [Orchesella cincta]